MYRLLCALILVAGIAGCSRTAEKIVSPREPGPNAIGYYCRMTLSEHKGPKGQIWPRGWNDPLWFSSVRDALTYVDQEIISEKELAAFWVNDMGQGTWDRPAAGAWVPASEAWYVVGSSKSGGMGSDEAVPFKERSAAESFAKENGGSVVNYASARKEVATAPAPQDAPGGGT